MAPLLAALMPPMRWGGTSCGAATALDAVMAPRLPAPGTLVTALRSLAVG
jgi:hypothetical protein